MEQSEMPSARRQSSAQFAPHHRAQRANIRISTDGRGRWMDHVFIARPWQSLEHVA